MNNYLTEKEKDIIIKEKLNGTGSRTIAKMISRGKSTVNEFWNKFVDKDVKDFLQGSPKKPNIFLFDIETSTILAHVWGLFKQTISLSAIEDDWYTICFSGKMLGDSDIFNHSVHNYELPVSGQYKDNERYVVEALWKYLDDCDIAVAYNGKKFDKKKINWKFFEYGLPEPSPYILIDPYLIIKGNFSPTSGKMDYIAKYCDDIENSKHSTDMSLWVACRNNDVQSLSYMSSYCDQDILLLEKVYNAVKHWDKNSPQMAMYYDDDEMHCNSCGSTNLEEIENKSAYTSLSKFAVYRCNDCNKIMRDRVNQTTKEKRNSFLMNVR